MIGSMTLPYYRSLKTYTTMYVTYARFIVALINHVYLTLRIHFVLALDRPDRVELIDPGFFDEFIRQEINGKHRLSKIVSFREDKFEVVLLQEKGNFNAGDRFIFIRKRWFPKMTSQDEIVLNRFFTVDTDKLKQSILGFGNNTMDNMLISENLVLTCIGRNRLILSRKK